MRCACARKRALSLALLVVALSGCTGSVAAPVPAVSAKPMRVMSLNMCSDQILLELLPPERITSVTWLARDPASSLLANEAMQVDVNHGLVEEVLRQKPDLILAGTFTTPAVRGMLKRLGFPLVEVAHPNSFEDVRQITRQIAAAVGEEARGEQLITEMDSTLDTLARQPSLRYTVVAWDRSGFSTGEETLQNAIFKAAGADNIANRPPVSGSGKPDTEVLIEAAPRILVQGSPFARAPSLGDNVEQHRVVRRFWTSQGRMLTVPQAYYVCGTPRIADAAARLRRDLLAASTAAEQPLPFAGVSQ